MAAVASAQRPADDSRRSKILTMIVSYGVLIALTLLFVSPLIWMLSTAFKTNQEATSFVPTWIPREPSTEGFDAIINTSEQTPVFRWFVNSMIAAIAQATIVVVTSALAAYALARLEFRGKKILTAM